MNYNLADWNLHFSGHSSNERRLKAVLTSLPVCQTFLSRLATSKRACVLLAKVLVGFSCPLVWIHILIETYAWLCVSQNELLELTKSWPWLTVFHWTSFAASWIQFVLEPANNRWTCVQHQSMTTSRWKNQGKGFLPRLFAEKTWLRVLQKQWNERNLFLKLRLLLFDK